MTETLCSFSIVCFRLMYGSSKVVFSIFITLFVLKIIVNHHDDFISKLHVPKPQKQVSKRQTEQRKFYFVKQDIYSEIMIFLVELDSLFLTNWGFYLYAEFLKKLLYYIQCIVQGKTKSTLASDLPKGFRQNGRDFILLTMNFKIISIPGDHHC